MTASGRRKSASGLRGRVPDASTELVGVVGHPIGHSLSPAVHNAALVHDGRNAVYLAFDVEPEGLEAFLRGMVAGGVRGINVTVPHKQAALSVCDEVSGEARDVEAVNTLVLRGRNLVGYNTDVEGVRRAIAELGCSLEGARALVVGAGGAGRAAAWALAPAVSEVWIANRTPARAERLRALLGARARVVPWRDLRAAASEADLLVHATTLGLKPDDPPLLEVAALSGRLRGVLDLVYGREETPLVIEARQAGIPAADGLSMLVWQAAVGYELMWDAPAPVEVMARAAAEAAGRA